MTAIPWTIGPPSPEQVAAHALAHPVCGDMCLWKVVTPSGLIDHIYLRPGSIVPPVYRHLSKWLEARWLPVTAEGVPVDYEALRAKVERLETLAISAYHWLETHGRMENHGHRGPNSACAECQIVNTLAELTGGKTQ